VTLLQHGHAEQAHVLPLANRSPDIAGNEIADPDLAERDPRNLSLVLERLEIEG
jgi:hypothetical protein